MTKSPRVLQNLIDHLNKLPGIGPKSAARVAFHLLQVPKSQAKSFAEAIIDVKDNIFFCKICHNIGEEDICNVCNDSQRKDQQILVVEDVLDLLAFERINEFTGKYHVLGGVISPVNGIGPEELNIQSLLTRLKQLSAEELIIATNPNLEGEATAMYLSEEVAKINPQIKITRLARGLPSGADLDYADKITLARALSGRTEL